jgi:hypothetical protein
MKWVGQHIWSFISRFRGDVYLENIADHGSDPDRFLTMDSTTGKVSYRTGSEVYSDIGAGATFTFTQSSVASTWTINHNLGKFPSVTVVDSGESVVKGVVVYNTLNQITITFFGGGSALAFSGKAYLN